MMYQLHVMTVWQERRGAEGADGYAPAVALAHPALSPGAWSNTGCGVVLPAPNVASVVGLLDEVTARQVVEDASVAVVWCERVADEVAAVEGAPAYAPGPSAEVPELPARAALTAQEATQLRTRLQALAMPAEEVARLVAPGLTRQQASSNLSEWVRNLPGVGPALEAVRCEGEKRGARR